MVPFLLKPPSPSAPFFLSTGDLTSCSTENTDTLRGELLRLPSPRTCAHTCHCLCCFVAEASVFLAKASSSSLYPRPLQPQRIHVLLGPSSDSRCIFKGEPQRPGERSRESHKDLLNVECDGERLRPPRLYWNSWGRCCQPPIAVSWFTVGPQAGQFRLLG